MKKEPVISRKNFLRLLASILLFPFIFIWRGSVKRHNKLIHLNREVKVPGNISEGVHFIKSVIVVKEKQKLNILSSRCTHLGCRINKTKDNKLVCPCHGSEFNLDGSCINGPAKRPLEKLDYSPSTDGKNIIVKLS